MYNKLSRKLKEKKGSAMLEFTLLVPFWLIIMFGIMDISAYVNARWDCMMISKTTVRYGSLKMLPNGENKSEDISKNDEDMRKVQNEMATTVINKGTEEFRQEHSKVYSGAGLGDMVYANTCADVHLNLSSLWGKNSVEVCQDYMLMRAYIGKKTGK